PAAGLDPALALARLAVAALAPADEARDVALGRRLGVGEERRAQPDLTFLAEQGARHMLHRAREVAEGDPAVDGQTFTLVEDGAVLGVDLLAPRHPPGRDDVNGRVVGLHVAHLNCR